MRIPGIDGDNSLTKLSGLDPKVLTLLQKIGQQPLLIQKIVISDKGGISLFTERSAFVSEVRLPLQNVKVLAEASHSQLSLRLSPTGNHVQLELIPGKLNASNDAMTLLFAKINLSNQTRLILSHPLTHNHAEPVTPAQADSTKPLPGSHLGVQAHAPDHLSTRQEASAQQSLLKAVELFLTTKPNEQLSVTKNLANLFNGFQGLLKSIQSVNLENSSLLPQLNNDAIRELIAKLQNSPNQRALYQSIAKLFSLSEQFQSSLDFSRTNRQLNIENRLVTSGNFFESRLMHQAKLSSRKSDSVPQADYKGQQMPGKSSDRWSQDIKLLALQLKETLQTLLQNLSSTDARALHAGRLIEQLSRLPAIAQLINFGDAQARLASQNPAMAPVDADYFLAELKKLFQSSTLSQLAWREISSAGQKLSQLNLSQESNLLNQQRALLNDMLKDVNAVINKIETNQLLSMRSESAQLQQFLIELPIHRAGQLDSFELLFEQKQAQEKKTSAKTWTVVVKFDLEPLGPMFARVRLKNERISTHFFARDSSTAKLLSDNLEHLKQSLLLAGVGYDEIQGQQGIVPDELVYKDKRKVDLKV